MSFDVKKKIEELNKSDIISGSNARYDIVLEEELKDLNSAGIILRHKKSGARVVVISNDDNNKVFSIGFKTPPFNDTGMQHIIEHCVVQENILLKIHLLNCARVHLIHFLML